MVEDLDRNGLKDVILVHNRFPSVGGFQGMSFQALLQIKKRIFQDKTARYFPGLHYSTGGWCFWLFLVDLNNDKRKDLVCSSLQSMKEGGEPDRPRVFLQQKNRQFKPVRITNLTGGREFILRGLLPADVDNDGQVEQKRCRPGTQPEICR